MIPLIVDIYEEAEEDLEKDFTTGSTNDFNERFGLGSINNFNGYI